MIQLLRLELLEALKDVKLDAVAKALDVDASTLTLHNVQDSTNGTYVVSSGSDNYAVSVDDATGNVVLNKATVAYTDATGSGSIKDTYVKVAADPTTGDATGFVTIQGKNFALTADAIKNGGDAPTDSTGEDVGDITTKAEFKGASTADPLALLDKAIASVDKFRSSLGAVQNRLSSAVTNLNNTTTNLSEAQSRIQDADYATEVSNMSKAQIVQQAGNSVLSKANQVPQQVLSLLQG